MSLRRVIRQPDLHAIGFLGVLVVAFFWRVLFGGRVLLPTDSLVNAQPWQQLAPQLGITFPHNHLLGDMLFQNYAWKSFIRDSLLQGDLPLWNPYIFGGAPFLAAGQQAVLYPPTVLFLVLPVAQAYAWFTALHVLLAGVGMYYFLRTIGGSRFGGLIGAITYMFAGYFVVSFIWPMVVGVVAWAPMLLAVIEYVVRRFEKPKSGSPLLYLLAGAIIVALQFLAGHLEYSFYLLFSAGWFGLWRIGVAYWRTRSGRRSLVAGFGLLAMVAVGTALAAAQLVPFFELAGASNRTGLVGLDEVIGWALPKARLLSFLVPNFFGNPAQHAYFDPTSFQIEAIRHQVGDRIVSFFEVAPARYKNFVEGTTYVGILPLLLAGMAVLSLIGRRTKAQNDTPDPSVGLAADTPWSTACFAALAVLALLLAFGSSLYGVLWHVPGFDQLRTPFRWVFPYSLAVAVLAGIGASGAADLVQRLNGFKGAGRGIASLAIGGGAGIGSILLLSRLRLDSTLNVLDAWRTDNAAFAEAFPNAQTLYAFEFGHILLFGALLFASGLVLLGILGAQRGTDSDGQGKRVYRLALVGAVLLVVVDLFAFGYDFNTAGDPSLLEARPDLVSALKGGDEPFRIVSFGASEPIKPNLSMLYDIQDARGYDSIILKRYAEFWSLIEPPSGLLYNEINQLARPESLRSPLLDLLNVRYVLSNQPIDEPGYRLVQDAAVKVYERVGGLPRAFTVHDVVVDQNALEHLGTPGFDPRSTAVIDRDPVHEPRPIGAGQQDDVEVTDYRPDELTVHAKMYAAGLLVLTDNYFPGWQVTVDGTPSEVLRANHTFRGVALSAGDHEVVFKFRPMSFIVGLYISAIAAVLVILGLGIAGWQSLTSKMDTSSTARRVLKNSATPIAAQLVNRLLDFAFAIFMLRTLGAEGGGKYALAVVIFGYFAIFTEFGLGTLLTREVAKDREAASRYFTNTLVVRLALVIATAPILVGIVALYRVEFGLTTDTMIAIGLLGISLVPSAVNAAMSSLFNAFEKMEFPAFIAIVTNLIKVALATPALLLGWGIIGLAGVAVVVSALTSVLFYLLMRRTLYVPQWEFDPKLVRWLVREAYPLMINNFLATIFFRIDVMILQPMKGDTANGYYTTAYRFIDGLGIIPSFFTLAIFPVMSRYADSARDSLVRGYLLALKVLLIVSLPIVVGTTLLADQIILVFFGEEFAPAIVALQLLIWFLPFSYVNGVTQYVLIAVGQQRFLTFAFVIAAVFNIVTNLALIPQFSYLGAAATTICSEIILMVPFLYAVRRHVGPITAFTIANLAVRPAIAALVMGAVVWQVQDLPLILPIAIGAVVYLAALLALRTFGADERAVLAQLRLGKS